MASRRGERQSKRHRGPAVSTSKCGKCQRLVKSEALDTHFKSCNSRDRFDHSRKIDRNVEQSTFEVDVEPFHFKDAVHALVYCKDTYAYREHQRRLNPCPDTPASHDLPKTKASSDTNLEKGEGDIDDDGDDSDNSDDSELTPSQERQARLDELSQLVLKSRNKAYRQRPELVGMVNMPREGYEPDVELPNQDRHGLVDGQTYISDRRAAKRRIPAPYMLIEGPKLQQDLNQLGILAAGTDPSLR
eukprot:m.266911 g.266911  ORF g.266911 m.266911 type:complete len:245 (+) comp17631_c0_seq2:4557-5291(+)